MILLSPVSPLTDHLLANGGHQPVGLLLEPHHTKLGQSATQTLRNQPAGF